MPTQPVSIAAVAIQGANDPNQTTSTQQGFYEAPNALFRAMNQQTLTSFQTLSNGSVGTFLQQHKLVNGDIATIINASLDYVLGDTSKTLPPLSSSVNHANTKRTFIPIIFQTVFPYTKTTTQVSNKSITTPTPLYIIFDSTPEKISFSKAANWLPTNFLGRPDPIFTYQNSDAIRLQLTGKFYAESFEKHKELLKLADYTMSLAYPSKANYMPSPIMVYIGEWKTLRCLVTQVTIDYSGPWKINVSQFDSIDNANNPASQGAIDYSLSQTADGKTKIPSHTPYYFEASFQLTIVNQDNTVSYAEDLISLAGTNPNGSLDFTKTSDPNIVALNAAANALLIPTQTGQPVPVSGLYKLSSTNSYIFDSGQISAAVDSTFQYTSAAQNLNLNAASNVARRSSDQGIISNAINSQMLTLFQKVSPSSTNTPGTTKSLNPFNKLF